MNVEKIKTHIRENKKVYLAFVGGIAFAGITYVIMRSSIARGGMCEGLNARGGLTNTASLRKETGLLGGSGSGLLGGSEVRPFFLFSKVNGNQVNKAITTIHTGSKGHSGFVTRSLDTGELFATQGDAARAFDLSPSELSSHLNGLRDTCQGYRFERLGIIS